MKLFDVAASYRESSAVPVLKFILNAIQWCMIGSFALPISRSYEDVEVCLLCCFRIVVRLIWIEMDSTLKLSRHTLIKYGCRSLRYSKMLTEIKIIVEAGFGFAIQGRVDEMSLRRT